MEFARWLLRLGEGVVVVLVLLRAGTKRFHGGGVRRKRDGGLVRLSQRPDLVWADRVVAAPNGLLLPTDSAIPAYLDQLAPHPTARRLRAGRPHTILRAGV